MPDTTSATVVAGPGEWAKMLTAEQVAGVVAGIPAIGEACDALKKAGWRASIAGNRITVNDEVFAQFIGATVGALGGIDARWVIYRIAGTPPVSVGGAEPSCDTSFPGSFVRGGSAPSEHTEGNCRD